MGAGGGGGGGGVAGICVPPQIWVPPTHIPRDICSPTQISLIIMQQWEVFPQGKMFPQVGWLIDIYCAWAKAKYYDLLSYITQARIAP